MSDATSYSELSDGCIAYKRSSGYAYEGPAVRTVARMAAFLDAYTNRGPVTKEAVEAYVASGEPGEALGTHNARATAIRQFALYLRMIGRECFVPEPDDCRHRGESGFVPRIISEQEMASVIDRADNGNLFWADPIDALEYRLVLRLLWCCGLRLGEALSLRVGDVDLESRAIAVRRAKGNRTRLLPLSDELASYLGDYLEAIDGRDGAAFLMPNREGGRRNPRAVTHRIQRIMVQAGVTRPDGTAPRVHDIRHSYAVAALAKMDAAGVEARCALPMLCTYMGHSDITSAEYYLRLTDELHDEIHEKMSGVYTAIFGKDEHNGEQ